jgi:hypothetical protein
MRVLFSTQFYNIQLHHFVEQEDLIRLNDSLFRTAFCRLLYHHGMNLRVKELRESEMCMSIN